MLLIFVPYVLWSLIYVKINNPTINFSNFFSLFWTDLITGNASYQLYYILLTLQYYAVFPFFLWFIKRVSKYPIWVLSISFIVQLLMIHYDFTYFQKGPLTQLPFVKNYLLPYQDRFFLTYQFFFFFGAFVAIYMNTAYNFVKKYGRFFSYFAIFALLCFSYYFFYQLHGKNSLVYALSVLQPSVVLFSTVIIFFFSWLSIKWAENKSMFRLIKAISDTSFGIFFVHVAILTYLIKQILPLLPFDMPIIEKIILIDLATFIFSLIICLLLIKTRLLSWTIGRIGKKG